MGAIGDIMAKVDSRKSEDGAVSLSTAVEPSAFDAAKSIPPYSVLYSGAWARCWNEARTSWPVTGVPSEYVRPLRSLTVHSSAVALGVMDSASRIFVPLSVVAASEP